MSEESQDSKCLLNNALSDGIIDQGQYEELMRRSEVKTELNEGRDIQRTLIVSGIIIIVFVLGFFLLLLFSDFTYVAKIAVLFLLTMTLFIGSWMAREYQYRNLHHGLLSGASNLFVFGYGYWFFNEIRESSWSSNEYIGQADRNPLLAIPLMVIPFMIIYYQIHKNSRGGAQLGLLSLIIGSAILFVRLGDIFEYTEDIYYIVGLIGASILGFIIFVNLLWMQGRLSELHTYYKNRYQSIDSLLATGYILGSLYLIFIFGVAFDEARSSLAIGAFIVLLLAFFMIFYGIKASKKGLFLTACGIVILSSWIGGLAIIGGWGFLIMPILSGFMLIGIAMFMKTVPEFNKKRY